MADKTLIMKEAQKYLAKGQVDKAISEWEKLIRESPDGNVYNIIGDLYLKKGDKKNAVDSFRSAAGFFRNEGFSLKALALYKKVLNINAADGDALYALGQLSEEKGLVTDAIKYCLAAVDAFSKEGKKDSVLSVYQKILSLSPSNMPLRNKIAEMFLKEGLLPDAAKEYLYMAGLHADNGELQKAFEHYQKVLEIAPGNREGLLGISDLYEKLGDAENATAYLKQAMILLPEDSDIAFRFAGLSFRTGDTASARAALEKIAGMDPSDMRGRKLLGDILLREGDTQASWAAYLPIIDEMITAERYEEAVELLDPFLEFNPLETGKRLVSLYRQTGDDARVVSALIMLGGAYREQEMRDEALSCYQDALRITPDDEQLRGLVDELSLAGEPAFEQAAEPEPEAVPESITVVAEGKKTAEEIFIEADIFSRYGLVNEAVKILEGLKMRDPQNMELHARLKSLYVESGDKESAVTECLIMAELHRRRNDEVRAEEMLSDALAISPEDPRLAQRAQASFLEPTSYRGEEPENGAGGPQIEEYEEEIAEADFYVRQGLLQEAAKILERLHDLFPDNKNINERLDSLGQISEITGSSDEMAGMFSEMEGALEETLSGAVFPEEEAPSPEMKVEEPAPEFENLILTDQDLMDAQEMPEPSLDSDVLEIFQEFKKGLEKELGDEDSETHYNLGIAYKEMGLIDDAIKEFQTSRSDPKRVVQSSTMLGVCYMEKGLYSLAVDVFAALLKEIPAGDEAHWAVKYDLAEAHAKAGNPREALRLFTEVYGWNARFRDVSEKLGQFNRERTGGQEPQPPEPPHEEPKELPKSKKDRVSYL